MSPKTLSAVMCRIRGKDTEPERSVAEALRARGWEFESHARDLPGRPDILFRHLMVAVFIDGDFWLGWRIPYGRTSSLISGGPRSRLPVAATPEPSVSCGAVVGRSFASGSIK